MTKNSAFEVFGGYDPGFKVGFYFSMNGGSSFRPNFSFMNNNTHNEE